MYGVIDIISFLKKHKNKQMLSVYLEVLRYEDRDMDAWPSF